MQSTQMDKYPLIAVSIKFKVLKPSVLDNSF